MLDFLEKSENVLEWRVHKAKENPRKTFGTILLLLFIGLAIFFLWQELFLTGLSVAILFCSIVTYFLPITYRLDEQGVTRTILGAAQHRQWSEFKSFYIDKNGILLSPFNEKSFLETYRGIFLMCGKNDEVREFVKRQMAKD